MVECLRCVLVMCAVGVAAAVLPDELQTGFFSLVDNLIRKTDNLELMDGVTIVKTSQSTQRSLNGDFRMLLLDRLNSFVNTHSVQIDLAEPEVEGRGKKKKLKNYLVPIILGVKAKMALLSAVIGNTIAVIAAKALLVSKIALILGMMLFLKKLVTNPPKHIEHAHIKHRKIVVPIEKSDVHHKKAEWDRHRSEDNSEEYSDPQEMAYRRQRPRH